MKHPSTLQSVLAAFMIGFSALPHAAAALQSTPAPVPAPAVANQTVAQDGARTILERALAATQALKSIECVAETTIPGVSLEGLALDPTAMLASPGRSRVMVRFDDGDAAADATAATGKPRFPRTAMRVEHLDGDRKGVVLTARDGKALRVDPTAKNYSAASELEALPLFAEIVSSPCGFPQVRQLGISVASDPESSKLVGTATIDDLECDLIEVSREMELVLPLPGKAEEIAGGSPVKLRVRETLAIARADGLPRQYRSALEIAELGDGGRLPEMVTTFTALRIDPTLDDALFPVTPPEGFERVEVVKPSWLIGTAAAQLAEGEFPDPEDMVEQHEIGFKAGLVAGEAAPDFALRDLDGKEVTLASLKGKVVLLDFWATWCAPCVAAMPTVQKLHDEFKGKDVVVLGVNTSEPEPLRAKELFAKKKFTYGCLLRGDALAAAYRIPGIPTLVVIGKDGLIEKIEVGLPDADGKDLRKAIEAALAK